MNVAHKVRKPLFERGNVLFAEFFFFYAAVHFQRADGCDDHHSRRLKSRESALYIEELFRAEIRAEPRFRNRVIAEF